MSTKQTTGSRQRRSLERNKSTLRPHLVQPHTLALFKACCLTGRGTQYTTTCQFRGQGALQSLQSNFPWPREISTKNRIFLCLRTRDVFPWLLATRWKVLITRNLSIWLAETAKEHNSQESRQAMTEGTERRDTQYVGCKNSDAP